MNRSLRQKGRLRQVAVSEGLTVPSFGLVFHLEGDEAILLVACDHAT